MKKLLTIILLLALCLPAFGQFNNTEPMFGQMLNLGHWSTDGLVFYWRGIEAGNAVDESFFGNHGTITGPTWVGDGLSFDGISDRVTIGDKSVLKNQRFTYMAWIKPSGISEDQIISLEFDGPWNHLAVVDGLLRVTITTATTENLDGTILVNDGLWHFVVATYDGIDMVICVDGVEDGRLGKVGTVVYTSEIITIGRRDEPIGAFNGEIAYVGVYNRALSASERAALYINPDLPMAQDPIWLLFSPDVAPSGIVPIIQAHARRRRAG